MSAGVAIAARSVHVPLKYITFAPTLFCSIESLSEVQSWKIGLLSISLLVFPDTKSLISEAEGRLYIMSIPLFFANQRALILAVVENPICAALRIACLGVKSL